jgi:hypothetical protein
MFETFFKIILRQSQVAIEFDDEIPGVAPKRMVTVIEGFHYTATSLSETSIHSVYDSDPWQPTCTAVDNFTRPVGGAIVYNNPFRRLDSLALDGSDGRFDKLLFIAYWGNDYVSRH